MTLMEARSIPGHRLPAPDSSVERPRFFPTWRDRETTVAHEGHHLSPVTAGGFWGNPSASAGLDSRIGIARRVPIAEGFTSWHHARTGSER